MTSRTLLSLCAGLLVAAPLAARPSRPVHPARPLYAQGSDLQRRADINRLNCVVTNIGSIGFDMIVGGPGLHYPRGSQRSVLFASGLWLGASVNGEHRLAVAEYATEYAPGRIVGGVPESPSTPGLNVWKVRAWRGSPQDTAHVERTPDELAADPTADPLVHHGWSEYLAAAVPIGAPTRVWRLPDTSTPAPDDSMDVLGPDVSGDLMLWCVFNDADPARHIVDAASTAPLGVEVVQTVFGFEDPGPLGDALFVRWQIRNGGGNVLEDLRLGSWADADIGSPTEDLTACDSTRLWGYTYNSALPDTGGYGFATPAFGVSLVRPASPARRHSFRRYFNGIDPVFFEETWNTLEGLQADGTPVVAPSGEEVRFDVPGDPVTGVGWLDANPNDKRTLLASRGETLLPGESTTFECAYVVGPGGTSLEAVRNLQCALDLVERARAAGLSRPFPSPECAATLSNCPRPAGFWREACQRTDLIESGALQLIAADVDAASNALDFGTDPLAGLCATVGDESTPRARARAEFAATLATIAAGSRGVRMINGEEIGLLPLTPLALAGLTARSVGELVARGATNPELFDAAYLNDNFTNRRALEGVDAGLGTFGGGAGPATNFFGSGLDPNVDPNPFHTVRLTFDRSRPHRAYRYLRLETKSGAAPPQGRAYLYGGYVPTFVAAVDSVTGETLSTLFVERCVTDDSGTILPAAFQPATFDSSWSPDDSPIGGREYLVVAQTPYSESPVPIYEVDGFFSEGTGPFLYVLWARLRLSVDVIDDGDGFVWRFGFAPTPGADGQLLALDRESPTDPATIAAWQTLGASLAALNRGQGIPLLCDAPTPALVSLGSASARPDAVDLEWHVSVPTVVTIERRTAGAGWRAQAQITPDGEGRVQWTDRVVEIGATYDYRIAFPDGRTGGDVRVVIPATHRLHLAGLRPNPAGAALSVAFTLASRERASLELFDVAGRRIFTRDVTAMGPGAHVLSLSARQLPAGVVLVRLSQGSAALTTKGLVIQ